MLDKDAVDRDYLQIISDLELLVNDYNLEEIDEHLEQLYDIKPVRLPWFILKAKITKKLNRDISDIKNLLYKKYRLMYENENLSDIISCLIELNDQDTLEQKRLIYHSLKEENLNDDFIVLHDEEYSKLTKKFVNDSLTESELNNLIENCYIRNSYTEYVLYSLVNKNVYGEQIELRQWILDRPNIEMFIERLENKSYKEYIVLNSQNGNFNTYAIVKSLKILNPENIVYVLDDNVVFDSQNHIDVSQTLSISIDNLENKEAYILFHPVTIRDKNENYFDNTEYIIDYINSYLANSGFTYILCSGYDADKLCIYQSLMKNTERLSMFEAYYFNDNLNFCWSGDYLSYMSEFYRMDIHNLVYREPECSFSIVIPVRNSIDTFKYTLKTCLNLRYQGSYEIVVSDNSTNANTEVFDYINAINDKRIKYYKTPRDLPLTKSFEFAFLNAKGEFILSLGADDGILPWALDVLDEVLKQYEENDVFRWDRGFYAWPGFGGGQHNELIIPRCYMKNNVEIDRIKSEDYMREVLNSPDSMYALPLLYINSGFRRRYLKKMLKETGRLWDGPSQDIYIGIVNISINSEIWNINYPITIAGMSGHSLGANSNSCPGIITDKCNDSPNLITISKYERLIPCIGIDIQNVQSAILRCASRGIISSEITGSYLTNIVMNFEQHFHLYSKHMDMFEEYINLYRSCIKKLSKEKLLEFDEKWYNKFFLPEKSILNESDTEIEKNNYSKGFDGFGLVLDASDFNVENIFDASILFQNILGM